MEIIIVFMLIVIAWAALSNNERQKALLAKYNNAEVVDMIIKKKSGKTKHQSSLGIHLDNQLKSIEKS